MGYSPWGHEESDATERLTQHALLGVLDRCLASVSIQMRFLSWGEGCHLISND